MSWEPGPGISVFSAGIFEGQVAVVTGGGTGIGSATSLVLAEHGADIVVASRRVENLERTAEQVRARGRTALVQRTDVRDPEACRQLIEATVAQFGRVDILVNNAGGSKDFPLAEWTMEEFDNSLSLNLRSVFELSRHAAAHMVRQQSGSIVNISSVASEAPMPGLAPYGMAKAGVNNLTRTMAAEYGSHGVRVNCVCLGFVKTAGFVRAMDSIGRDADDVAATSNAIGRAGTPEEIAYPILFLVSAASSFVSGETLHINGGPAVTGPW
jgi:NAD(P)-dependent dehydrogenase (short-subunit alcohol dehydrogenase family)